MSIIECNSKEELLVALGNLEFGVPATLLWNHRQGQTWYRFNTGDREEHMQTLTHPDSPSDIKRWEGRHSRPLPKAYKTEQRKRRADVKALGDPELVAKAVFARRVATITARIKKLPKYVC